MTISFQHCSIITHLHIFEKTYPPLFTPFFLSIIKYKIPFRNQKFLVENINLYYEKSPLPHEYFSTLFA
ncbi:MAG: hypothetical protein C4554_04905 [Dethiobacter sp.]|nr:MAG: hypothetical protein C4554_04905 [Dethiobacter sp.]